MIKTRDYDVSIHALLAECDRNGESHYTFLKVSIHALLAECDLWLSLSKKGMMVSIHALLAECDMIFSKRALATYGFNPRTPCGVRRHINIHWHLFCRFQSTHSLRSATEFTEYDDSGLVVSIHALLAECDGKP